MLVRSLSPHDLQRQLRRGDFKLCVGPYVYRIQSNLDAISLGLGALYADFPLAEEGSFVDFDIAVTQSGLSSRARNRCEFLFEQQRPFDSIAVEQCYAFLEWGMNWCVSLLCNEYLKLHAAVVARGDTGIIMPGVPGAGKSTLCAGLALEGWRVLSDEHALIPPGSTHLVPLCRPVSLKNESIDKIRAYSTAAVLGPVSRNTHKGVVAHMKADMNDASHRPDPLPARMMVFPQYKPGEAQSLAPRARTASFVLAAYHSFNYSLMGETGFDAMHHLVERVDCYDLNYHDLHWAVAAMEELLS